MTGIAALVLFLGAASSASADIIFAAVRANVIAAPASVQEAAFESDGFLQVFPELQDVFLSSDVRVNVTEPGDYFCGCALPFPVPKIKAGTQVDSYFVHADPSTGGIDYFGILGFDTRILGVIFGGTLLTESDLMLGAPGTLYPAVPDNRGLAIRNGLDLISISPDRHFIAMGFLTRRNFDQIRIITAAQVPEPATLALVGGGLAAAVIRRRRSRKG